MSGRISISFIIDFAAFCSISVAFVAF